MVRKTILENDVDIRNWLVRRPLPSAQRFFFFRGFFFSFTLKTFFLSLFSKEGGVLAPATVTAPHCPLLEGGLASCEQQTRHDHDRNRSR